MIDNQDKDKSDGDINFDFNEKQREIMKICENNLDDESIEKSIIQSSKDEILFIDNKSIFLRQIENELCLESKSNRKYDTCSPMLKKEQETFEIDGEELLTNYEQESILKEKENPNTRLLTPTKIFDISDDSDYKIKP